ncbi:MAG: acyltransferase family protein [Arcticibacter sp.]
MNATQSAPLRYLSLDVLRGLTVCLMIIVNTPGDWGNIYAPFRHAEWHGFTLTDLVFPTFLFAVGNSMSFSMKKLGDLSQSAFLARVFKRTLIIFAIGYFLNGFPFYKLQNGEIHLVDLTSIRIMGVLQRIAICYFLASLMIYYFTKRTVLIASCAILFLYWAILCYFGDPGAPYSLEGNAVLKFDLLFFDPAVLYKGFGIPFDPEGLLSSLPAIVNVTAGYLVADYIRESGHAKKSLLKMMLLGWLLVAMAQLWNLYLPINKPIWTSSYALHAIGLDLIILCVLVYVIEVCSIKRWTYFFEVFGKNPLFLYALSGTLIMILYSIPTTESTVAQEIYAKLYTRRLADKNASLLFAISYMLVLWCIGYVLDRLKIYLRV